MATHVGHILHIIPGSLEAVRDEQPGPHKTHKFFVTVEVQAEVDLKVTLVAAIPQGMNPLEKLLRFDVVQPDGVHPSAIARRTIRYEEVPPGATYTGVLLEDGKETTHAKVRIVV